MWYRNINKMVGQFSYLSPLILRLVIGVIMTAHGCDKLFGCFHGGGFEQTANQFEQLLGPPGWLHAALGGGGELVGGMLLLLGLFTRVGAFLCSATMVVAIVSVHLSNGLFASDGGFEYPLTILAGSLSLLLTGGGNLLCLDDMIYGQDK